MENKLGIDNIYILEKVQEHIVRTKMSVLDETFTFNESEYNFDYLIKLYDYLFGDIYKIERKSSKDFPREVVTKINTIMYELNIVCIYYPNDTSTILDLLFKLWKVQAFYDGNTRVILAYLKVLISAFNLNLEIDLNKEIPIQHFTDFKDRMCLVSHNIEKHLSK